jgi:hypothetical protein
MSYIGERSKRLEVFITEHKHNLTQGLLEKSKLVQDAYEEDQKIYWKEAKVLQIEPNTTYGKYKESVHMSLVTHPASQPACTSLASRFPSLKRKTENYNSALFRLYGEVTFLCCCLIQVLVLFYVRSHVVFGNFRLLEL